MQIQQVLSSQVLITLDKKFNLMGNAERLLPGNPAIVIFEQPKSSCNIQSVDPHIAKGTLKTTDMIRVTVSINTVKRNLSVPGNMRPFVLLLACCFKEPAIWGFVSPSEF